MNYASKQETLDWLDERYIKAEKNMAAFLAKLLNSSTDACAALEHSDDAFETAAQIHVFALARRALTGRDSKATPETLAAHAQHEAFKRVHPARSSSMTSRIMRAEIGAAWVRLYEFLTTRM